MAVRDTKDKSWLSSNQWQVKCYGTYNQSSTKYDDNLSVHYHWSNKVMSSSHVAPDLWEYCLPCLGIFAFNTWWYLSFSLQNVQKNVL